MEGNAAMHQELTELRSRLTRLEDERAIMDLFSRYSHAMDYGNGDLYRQVFADEGIFDVRLPDGKLGHREEGLSELVAYLESRAADRAITMDKHVVAQPMITRISETEAEVESFWLAIHDKGAGPIIFCYGRYDDHFVKKDGEWRLMERRATTEAPIQSKSIDAAS